MMWPNFEQTRAVGRYGSVVLTKRTSRWMPSLQPELLNFGSPGPRDTPALTEHPRKNKARLVAERDKTTNPLLHIEL